MEKKKQNQTRSYEIWLHHFLFAVTVEISYAHSIRCFIKNKKWTRNFSMEIEQEKKYNAQTQNQHRNADDWEENGRLETRENRFEMVQWHSTAAREWTNLV